jgi:hypothetical protein
MAAPDIQPVRPIRTHGTQQIIPSGRLGRRSLGLQAAPDRYELPDNNAWLMIALMVAGALVLVEVSNRCSAEERAGEALLLSIALFLKRMSNLALSPSTSNGCC